MDLKKELENCQEIEELEQIKERLKTIVDTHFTVEIDPSGIGYRQTDRKKEKPVCPKCWNNDGIPSDLIPCPDLKGFGCSVCGFAFATGRGTAPGGMEKRIRERLGFPK